MPWFGYVDWVEYYKWNELDGFSWEWKNEFDSLDNEFWDVASEGGWDKLRGTLSDENVFTSHGMLVMAIDSEDNRIFDDEDNRIIEDEDQYEKEDDEASKVLGMTSLGFLLFTAILTA